MTQQKPDTEEREHYFAHAKSMLLSSIGRLPTALVIILLLSMAVAALAGAGMVLTKAPPVTKEFMPLRLTPSENSSAPDIKKLQGSWIYQSNNYAMSFTIIGDRFEWIIVFGDVPEAQYYSRGNFRIVGDVMVLSTRPDLGKPHDRLKPWMKYLPIAMTNINTRILLSGKDLIWNIPLSEQPKIISQSSQIFVGHEDGNIEWFRP